MSIATRNLLCYDRHTQNEQMFYNLKGDNAMNEQEARELLDNLTSEEKVRLYEMILSLRRNPAPAPVQSV